MRCRTTWATWWCCAQTSANRRMALLKVSLAGAVTALGGAVGYFLVGQLQDFLPYFLALASSSFVYCGAGRFDSPVAKAAHRRAKPSRRLPG